MIERLTFDRYWSSIKDGAGITLHEIEIRAMGSVFGIPGGGAAPEDTVLGTFSTASLGVAINITNQTGADVAAAISGTFDTTVDVDRSLLPEDIKFCYRVTTATGASIWHCVHKEAICAPGIADVTVSPPDAMLEDTQLQNWVWNIQAQKGNGNPLGAGDFVLIELVREDDTVHSFAYVPVGGDPTDPNDILIENNWNSLLPGDGKSGGYITVIASFSSPNLDSGATQLKFSKKLWAVDNGIAGVDSGETLTVRVSSIDSTCNQTPTPDEGDMTPIIFAEMLLPFMGKQAATPFSEYRYPTHVPIAGGNPCSGDEWFGNSLRNGALTSPISEIRFDVDDDATDVRTFNFANSPIHFPLPPLVQGDAFISCTPGSSTPNIGFDFGAYYVDPLNSYHSVGVGQELASGHIRNSAEIDFDVSYFGLVTVRMNWSMYVEAENNDDPEFKPELWDYDDATTRTLIVRGDSEVYGQNTTNSGLTVSLAFNINTTRVSLTGATAWTANTKVDISQTPGLIPGVLDSYDITVPSGAGVSGGLADPPNAGIAANSISINRVFPSEGIFYVRIVAETDASPDGKVFRSEAEGYLLLASS